MQLISTISSSLPPALPGIAGGAFTAFQILASATSYKAETNADTRAKYSKFATNVNSASTAPTKEKGEASAATWPSQVGMMVIYTPALLASVALLKLGSLQAGTLGSISFPPPSPAAVLCALHFAKRVCEVLVVHKYSGRVERSTASFIGFYYMIVAVLIGLVSDPNPSAICLKVGKTLFGIGLAGNFYHHRLLAKLRGDSDSSGGDKKKYVAPKGGLFDYVAAPHYLFELIGWLGIAIASNHLNVYLVFASMSSYLSGRSVAQNDFNRKKFSNDEWPETRKNLIPFVF